MASLNSAIKSSGFSSLPNAKYYDNITATSGSAAKTTHPGQGFARGGWYSDYTTFVNTADPWVVRGGYYSQATAAGGFAFGYSTGGTDTNLSARVVLSEV